MADVITVVLVTDPEEGVVCLYAFNLRRVFCYFSKIVIQSFLFMPLCSPREIGWFSFHFYISPYFYVAPHLATRDFVSSCLSPDEVHDSVSTCQEFVQCIVIVERVIVRYRAIDSVYK